MVSFLGSGRHKLPLNPSTYVAVAGLAMTSTSRRYIIQFLISLIFLIAIIMLNMECKKLLLLNKGFMTPVHAKQCHVLIKNFFFSVLLVFTFFFIVILILKTFFSGLLVFTFYIIVILILRTFFTILEIVNRRSHDAYQTSELKLS